MHTDRPNLDRARAYTRAIGPITIAVGCAIALQGAFLMSSALAAYLALPVGCVLALFGTAAYSRTETTAGLAARWGMIAVFLSGGMWSLMQWVPLIWGSHNASYQGNISVLALWLTAGPALFVPGVLAAVRPGWTPLIAVPAILSIAFAAFVGYAALSFIGVVDNVPLTSAQHAQLVGISGSAMILLITAVYRAIREWRS